MSWSVRLTSAAEDDLQQARRWYHKEAPHVGPGFRQAVREAQARIGANPFLYPEVHQGLRRASVHTFPYSLFYRIRHDHILVIAITHQARHPRVWRQR